ncbi:Protoporphyrinogen IX oxidase, novel form, HemJ [hydrothermal vent metagenome]|uniref:Protoporphyrinogen IX oxidase, novel form, HemJ n=1 Tax=hydrothermal vent metagenome TaxID=652676 RepID=A0A3B1BAU2_9ZZZZ
MKLVEAFHIIFMVTWFAGLFYLPRLFVYHAMSEDNLSNERFKIMERKLFFGIMTPGAIITIALGIWLLIDYAWLQYGNSIWLHVKLSCVAIIVVYHIYCGKLLFAFKHDKNTHSHVFYRWFNEFPVLLLVVIIIMVVVKPWL